jgi:hypothetical protein
MFGLKNIATSSSLKVAAVCIKIIRLVGNKLLCMRELHGKCIILNTEAM